MILTGFCQLLKVCFVISSFLSLNIKIKYGYVSFLSQKCHARRKGCGISEEINPMRFVYKRGGLIRHEKIDGFSLIFFYDITGYLIHRNHLSPQVSPPISPKFIPGGRCCWFVYTDHTL